MTGPGADMTTAICCRAYVVPISFPSVMPIHALHVDETTGLLAGTM